MVSGFRPLRKADQGLQEGGPRRCFEDRRSDPITNPAVHERRMISFFAVRVPLEGCYVRFDVQPSTWNLV